jgi:branched-chain amino acid transport system substrate-binding protein
VSIVRAVRVTLAVVLAFAVASCGGSEDPFRLAVQVECQGGFEGFADPQLAGAYLPLLERGAHLSGPSPADGVEGAAIAGRSVEVRPACTESLSPAYAVVHLRELVEEWRPDAVVGSGVFVQDGIIVRDLARRYPDVTFVVTEPVVQEITLHDPARNVFRIAQDNAQSVAGLGEYAYEKLGWRTAAVVGGSTPDDWEQAAGFMAEFCSLGGTARRDDGSAWVDAKGAAERYAKTVDGVAVLAAWLLPTDFLRETTKRGEAASRLVLGGWVVEYRDNLAVPQADLEGVTVASWTPMDAGPAPWRQYLASSARAYPSLPPASVRYRNGVEAVATALEDAGGDAAKLQEALAEATVPTVPTATTFDANRQAVSSIYLSQLGKKGVADARTMSVVDSVEQTFGGIFGPRESAPTATSSSCDPGAKPPPWAR